MNIMELYRRRLQLLSDEEASFEVNEPKSTFTPIDDLIFKGINKNNVYKNSKMRARSYDRTRGHSHLGTR